MPCSSLHRDASSGYGWGAQVLTNSCNRRLESRVEHITAIAWRRPDGSGFISGSVDGRVVIWMGKSRIYGRAPGTYKTLSSAKARRDYWSLDNPGHAILPLEHTSPISLHLILQPRKNKGLLRSTSLGMVAPVSCYRTTLDPCCSIAFRGLHVGNLRYEDLDPVNQRFTGHTQTDIIIRGSFVGADEQFVASGSEDGNVYVWDHSSGLLVKVLSEHGTQYVCAVTCNPANPNIFASCSYDSTIRLWELKYPDMSWSAVRT
ncbi:WD40-repeat-containing domain protein [Cerioporus squamosus]|nr:WD40-repeat-containing domain protein [Cerioporus squamosus]